MEHSSQRILLHFFSKINWGRAVLWLRTDFPLIWYSDLVDGASTFYVEVYLWLWIECPEIAFPYSLGNETEPRTGMRRKSHTQITPNLDFKYRIPCGTYSWPMDWWASREMRSPKGTTHFEVCADFLQPQTFQWLRGTWAPLLWNVKWRVANLVAPP